MVRKTRTDKKDTICKRCDHEYSTSQKLYEYLKRKNLCKPLQEWKDVTSIKVLILAPIQEFKQHSIQEPAPKPELIYGRDYITEEEAKNWVNPNARKPRERIKTWGARLQKRWKELDLGVESYEANDLDGCKILLGNKKNWE